MTYQALIFDIDGTLTNSQPAYTQVMRAVLTEYGKSFTDADAQTTFPMSAEQAMAHLGIPADQFDQFQARYEAVMADHFTDITLYDGIEALFSQLPSDLKIGIVTSQRRNEIEAGMAQYDIMDRMAVVIGADDTPKRKPDPLPLLTALQKIKVAPQDALFVGDSLSDEQTAAAANVDFGLAVWGMDPNANHQMTAYRFENPLDILRVF
ncbi:HAD family hydrolase [Lactiplantibacillus mudanjiangensis]|uniref:HAD family hydrolase [Lactobacillus sp.] n=1 Tax=Lactiplantibacillus mudanjiangensis TaxID=1296538 RepID=A0A660E5C7_9LACO|nr:HAD family hydrolase [Lactiplantibacillus mudanjiangensis]VDG23279.1 HAD family hydrolase [Lactobacillus sp.] [Lactiplantibacillus mudanjiangensis]VDG28240.1 HAD family hydrolase [Lactobacillus sp.] [Lactiplantibacillus mudanjiangensis]